MMRGGARGLNARIRAHRLYSERRVDFYAWVVAHVPWQGGERVLDVGGGTGAYFPYYREHTSFVVSLDASGQMVAEARRNVRGEALLVADAVALPFADATFHVVFANHVLFFVDEISAALRECRRVLQSGGIFVAATNTADSQAALYEVHARALAPIGRRPQPPPHARFSVESGLPLVRQIFGNARANILENAFRFPTVDAALDYYLSGPINLVEGSGLTPAEREAVTAEFSRMVKDIIARDGFWRVPKNAGVIMARKE